MSQKSHNYGSFQNFCSYLTKLKKRRQTRSRAQFFMVIVENCKYDTPSRVVNHPIRLGPSISIKLRGFFFMFLVVDRYKDAQFLIHNSPVTFFTEKTTMRRIPLIMMTKSHPKNQPNIPHPTTSQIPIETTSPHPRELRSEFKTTPTQGWGDWAPIIGVIYNPEEEEKKKIQSQLTSFFAKK